MNATKRANLIGFPPPLRGRVRVGGPRPGLTLIELLVVLLILVILTTLAVQSTDNLVLQSRYEATQATLKTVQESIVGPRGAMNADGTPGFSGFVADMGRLPKAVPDSTRPGYLTAEELWNSSLFPAG